MPPLAGGSNGVRLQARYYRGYPPEAPLGYAEDVLVLVPGETVFVLVDVYGQGFDDDIDLGDAPEFYRRSVEANRTIVREHIVPARAAARAAGIPVVYLNNYLSPGLTAQSEWRQMSMRTAGIDVLEAWPEPNDILSFSRIVAPGPGEPVVRKQLYSGFFETHFDSLLRSLNARTLVLVGFDSRICLGTTAIDAMYRNYRVVVLRDCTSTGEYVETAAAGWANWMAIRFIESNVGYTSTAAEWVQACRDHDTDGRTGGA
jgi:nicotinamidase-related amidase